MNEMLLAAIKLGDQIERYGSYAGYAAVIGLGVLSMLYFAQAREVKRLREWAGRSPERDAELAQRMQTDAQRRVVAQPVPAAAPASIPAAIPRPVPAAQPGAPQTAAAKADAARKAAAATVLQKFQQPGAGPPASPLVGPPGSLARPGQPLVPGVPAPGAPSSVAPAPMPGAPTPGAPVPPDPATAGAVAAAHQAATAARSPALSNGAGQDMHESAARPPAPTPDLPPRTARAATEAASSGARGGSRARVGLIAGGVAGVILIGVVLTMLLTGGEDTPSAGNSATDGVPPPVSAPPAASSAPKVDRKATQVAVLNGTTQNGLAGSVANKIEDGGFTILSRGNNSDQQIAMTTVSFAEGSEPAARLVAKIVDVPTGAVQPMNADTQGAVAPEAKVVVIVGNNLGSTG